MSNPICKIRVIAYQKNGKPIKEGEEPEEFEFCCWDNLYKWLSKYSLHKCQDCKNGKKTI
jgi:hypothetical protein